MSSKKRKHPEEECQEEGHQPSPKSKKRKLQPSPTSLPDALQPLKYTKKYRMLRWTNLNELVPGSYHLVESKHGVPVVKPIPKGKERLNSKSLTTADTNWIPDGLNQYDIELLYANDLHLENWDKLYDTI